MQEYPAYADRFFTRNKDDVIVVLDAQKLSYADADSLVTMASERGAKVLLTIPNRRRVFVPAVLNWFRQWCCRTYGQTRPANSIIEVTEASIHIKRWYHIT